MAPNAGGVPTDTIAAVINRDFGSYNNFVASFKQNKAVWFCLGLVSS
jgi:Fe-Mn family superoxide dismutase